MGKLRPLVEKEVKDLLRDPRIYIGLLVPVILLPLMGLLIGSAMEGTFETVARGFEVGVLDYDGTEMSANLVSFLSQSGLKVSSLHAGSVDEALKVARELGCRALIVIPKGFGEGLSSMSGASIDVYIIISSASIASVGIASGIEGVLRSYSDFLSSMLITRFNPGVDPEVIKSPITLSSHILVGERILSGELQPLLSQLMFGYGIIIPLVLFIVGMIAAQMAATATAIENEEKTLETLLTLPVRRYDILMAKLIGSSLVALVGTLFFSVGFLFYIEGVMNLPTVNPSEPFLSDVARQLPAPSLEPLILLAVSLAVAIFFITSLGVVIGAVSSDVRMSNSLLGVVIVPITIPSILIIYGGPEGLPMMLKLFVYVMPTSYPMLIARSIPIGSIPIEALYGIPYSVFLTVAVIYLTSRLLAPERLLTLQHRLRLRRTKKGRLSLYAE